MVFKLRIFESCQGALGVACGIAVNAMVNHGCLQGFDPQSEQISPSA
jgi:hypothetical protein